MASWSDLPLDLVIQIAKGINLYEDFISFGGVCTSCRSAALNVSYKKLDQIPWLMLAEKKGSNNLRDFFSLSKGKIHSLMLPEASAKCCFSSQGWLMTITEDLEINLLHPLSRIQIRLPDHSTLRYRCHENSYNSYKHVTYILKAALSTSPSWASDYIVMVIYKSTNLAFCRSGDTAWTTVERVRRGFYFDVIYYKGKFYAIDSMGRIVVCDIGDPNSSVAAQEVGMMPIGLVNTISVLHIGLVNCIEKLYLVESSGSLLVVSREGVTPRPIEEGSSYYTYGTTRFQVFEVDLSNGKWVEVKSLGNRTLFLGHNSSFSVEASEFPGCKPNCIYFTDDSTESYIAGPEEPYWRGPTEGGGADMGIYNLQDGTIESHFKGESFCFVTPPIWIVPTF